MKTVITDAGINACINAGLTGPQINIASVSIGSSIITPTAAMTDVTGKVWSGDTSYIRYQKQDSGLFAFRVTLDEGIGDFDIGNIGLFLGDGTMFCITSMDKADAKIKNGTDVVGNRRIIAIPIKLAGISNLIDVSILVPDEASIPFVQTENDLPAPEIAAFSTYEVLNHTLYNTPVLALRTQSKWVYFQPQSSDTISSFAASLFDDSVEVGMPIYFNTIAQKFMPANGLDDSKGYLGIRGSLNNVISNDTYYNEDYDLIPGTCYYADGGDNSGLFTTIQNNCLIGKAITSTTILLDVQNESKLNKVSSINTSTPSQFKYPSEDALVQYVSNAIQQIEIQLSTTSFNVGDIKYSITNNLSTDTGWLLCNGKAVDRTEYSALFAIIGTNFGIGDGSTTFNLPDYRGKFLRCIGGNALSSIYTPQAEGLPNISGGFGTNDNGTNGTSGAFYNDASVHWKYNGGNWGVQGGNVAFSASRSSSIYGASTHVTPENYAVYYYLKAK